MIHLHHIHLFAEDLDASVEWWQKMLGAEVCFDDEMGGSRNVFLRIGSGRLHLYDQAPRDKGKNAVHHVGIRVDKLADLVTHLRESGIALRNDIREFGNWRYIMCPAPDDVLLELFEIETDEMEPALKKYFDDETRY